MRRAAPALLSVFLVFVLAACLDAENKKPAPNEVVGTLSTASTTTAGGAPSGQGDAAAGKQVFLTAGCTSCHTLADAGAKGTVGPNLDDAKPSHDLVVERVTNGKGAMPPFKDQLNETQIQNVAAYVVQATSG